MAKKIRVAVIGAGNMGRHHARNYFEMETTELVAIADTDIKNKALAKKYRANFYEDYRELLSLEKPEIVNVCVPTLWHKEVASEAVKAGANVLVEKPIASSLAEAQDLIDLAKEKKVKLTVGHIERFNPVVLLLKELIKKGKLGKIISVMARRANPIPARIKDANVILDIGVHDIDLINFILDKKPVTVHAYGGRALLQKQEDYADILLEYPKDEQGLKVTGHIQVNWLTPVKIRKLNVTGTKGYAVLNLITQELVLFDTKYTHEFDDYQDYVGKFKETKGRLIPVKSGEPLKLELEDFVKSIQRNREPLVRPEDGFEALRIALEATKSIKRRRI